MADPVGDHTPVNAHAVVLVRPGVVDFIAGKPAGYSAHYPLGNAGGDDRGAVRVLARRGGMPVVAGGFGAEAVLVDVGACRHAQLGG